MTNESNPFVELLLHAPVAPFAASLVPSQEKQNSPPAGTHVPSRVMPVLFGPIAPPHSRTSTHFALVLKPEGFMTAPLLLDSRCNPFLPDN